MTWTRRIHCIAALVCFLWGGAPDASQDGEREASVRNCPHRIPLGLRAINGLSHGVICAQPGTWYFSIVTYTTANEESTNSVVVSTSVD